MIHEQNVVLFVKSVLSKIQIKRDFFTQLKTLTLFVVQKTINRKRKCCRSH